MIRSQKGETDMYFAAKHEIPGQNYSNYLSSILPRDDSALPAARAQRCRPFADMQIPLHLRSINSKLVAIRSSVSSRNDPHLCMQYWTLEERDSGYERGKNTRQLYQKRKALDMKGLTPCLSACLATSLIH